MISKLAQVKMLVAENEVLQARESVLQSFVREGDAVIRQLQDEARADWGGRGAAAGGWAAEPQASAPAAAALLAARGFPLKLARTAAADAAASRARVERFVGRYHAYRASILASRLKPDGSVRPLAARDPAREVARELVATVMTMSSDEAYHLLALNVATRECEAHPEGMWGRVAKKLKLT